MTNEQHAQTLEQAKRLDDFAYELANSDPSPFPSMQFTSEALAKACRAGAAALRAPQGWQPMATAPKPGVPILVWVPRKMSIYAVIHDDDGGFFRVLHPSGPVLAECPTHWQPLPLPPVSPATEQE